MRKRLRKKLARKKSEAFFFDDIRTARMHGARVWSYEKECQYAVGLATGTFPKDVYTCRPKCRWAKQHSIPQLKEIERRLRGEITRHRIDNNHVAWY